MSAPENSAFTGPETPSELFRLTGEALRAVGLSGVLIGGHAVNTWCEPRLTRDIDLTVAATGAAIDGFVSFLEQRGLTVTREQMTEDGQWDFVRMEPPARPELRVELQVAHTPFQDQLIERAKSGEGLSMPVATPEDLIVLKLIANRSKDWVDLFHLAEIPGLDWEYMERHAAEWEVTDRLARLRRGEYLPGP